MQHECISNITMLIEDLKGCRLYDSVYMTSWKRNRHRQKKKNLYLSLSSCYGLGEMKRNDYKMALGTFLDDGNVLLFLLQWLHRYTYMPYFTELSTKKGGSFVCICMRLYSNDFTVNLT